MLWKDAEKFRVASPEDSKGLEGPGGPEDIGRETGTHWVRRKGQAPSGEAQSTPLPNWAALAPCSVKWKQPCVPTSLRSR